jgi:hypothetical protein
VVIFRAFFTPFQSLCSLSLANLAFASASDFNLSALSFATLSACKVH